MIGARFAQNMPSAKKSFWTHRLGLLGDEAQLKARFGPFGDRGNIDARWVHSLRRTYHRLGNHFGHTRWNSKVTWVMWNLSYFYLETVLASVQARCMVCARCTIGSKSVLDAPDGTTRLLGSSGSLFRSFRRWC